MRVAAGESDGAVLLRMNGDAVTGEECRAGMHGDELVTGAVSSALVRCVEEMANVGWVSDDGLVGVMYVTSDDGERNDQVNDGDLEMIRDGGDLEMSHDGVVEMAMVI